MASDRSYDVGGGWYLVRYHRPPVGSAIAGVVFVEEYMTRSSGARYDTGKHWFIDALPEGVDVELALEAALKARQG